MEKKLSNVTKQKIKCTTTTILFNLQNHINNDNISMNNLE